MNKLINQVNNALNKQKALLADFKKMFVQTKEEKQRQITCIESIKSFTSQLYTLSKSIDFDNYKAVESDLNKIHSQYNKSYQQLNNKVFPILFNDYRNAIMAYNSAYRNLIAEIKEIKAFQKKRDIPKQGELVGEFSVENTHNEADTIQLKYLHKKLDRLTRNGASDKEIREIENKIEETLKRSYNERKKIGKTTEEEDLYAKNGYYKDPFLNPFINEAEGFDSNGLPMPNCYKCVDAFVARSKGYNVRANPKTEGSTTRIMIEYRSAKNDFGDKDRLMHIDTKEDLVNKLNDIGKDENIKVGTIVKINGLVNDGEYPAHTFCAIKTENGMEIYDPYSAKKRRKLSIDDRLIETYITADKDIEKKAFNKEKGIVIIQPNEKTNPSLFDKIHKP